MTCDFGGPTLAATSRKSPDRGAPDGTGNEVRSDMKETSNDSERPITNLWGQGEVPQN